MARFWTCTCVDSNLEQVERVYRKMLTGCCWCRSRMLLAMTTTDLAMSLAKVATLSPLTPIPPLMSASRTSWLEVRLLEAIHNTQPAVTDKLSTKQTTEDRTPAATLNSISILVPTQRTGLPFKPARSFSPSRRNCAELKRWSQRLLASWTTFASASRSWEIPTRAQTSVSSGSPLAPWVCWSVWAHGRLSTCAPTSGMSLRIILWLRRMLTKHHRSKHLI